MYALIRAWPQDVAEVRSCGMPENAVRERHHKVSLRKGKKQERQICGVRFM